jgi:drug/metabolite transporter (DMT)-like permease
LSGKANEKVTTSTLKGATVRLTLFALIAFAGNSILARLALGNEAIDPASFTALRLGSGALCLCLIVLYQNKSFGPIGALNFGNWKPAAVLSVYAVSFSFAYIWLETGVGALILFSAVQATMIGVALWRGDKLRRNQWIGIVIAMGGLGWLLAPGAGAPSVVGGGLMILSGICWAFYSLHGQGAEDPTLATTRNFIMALPAVAVLAFAAFLLPTDYSKITGWGVTFALTSGAITSGLGYIVWYAALRSLRTTTAAVVQLLVPVLAAVGGIVFMNEAITLRLLLASSLILGGIYITIKGAGET